MSAEYLREVAALMRAEANDAEATGAWEWRGQNGEVWWQQATRAGRFIQSQSPAVALAVADWLKDEADRIDDDLANYQPSITYYDSEAAWVERNHRQAMTVARAYRGDS